jgi:hypothetical protein
MKWVALMLLGLSGCTTPHNGLRVQIIFNVIFQRDSSTTIDQRAPIAGSPSQQELTGGK